jgi:hypothetical protein
MEKFMAVRKVQLADHHLNPGRTSHVLVDSQGRRPFAPFKELVIAHYPGAVGYYLMHHSIDGTGTDTRHETLEDAIHQGTWEFDVKANEWVEINEPYVA